MDSSNPVGPLGDDTKPPKRLNRSKRQSIAKKLTYDEWITRERAFHDRLWAVSRLYESISLDTIFIAFEAGLKQVPVILFCINETNLSGT